VNTGVVELLDHPPMLKHQLLALQRRARRGGLDDIDHPRGGHDDVANVAAGALVHAIGIGAKKGPTVAFGGMFAQVPAATVEEHRTRQQTFLARHAQRTIAHFAAQDRRARLDFACEDAQQGPTIADVAFRIHTRSRR
jgi:hypothetical protein